MHRCMMAGGVLTCCGAAAIRSATASIMLPATDIADERLCGPAMGDGAAKGNSNGVGADDGIVIMDLLLASR